MNTPLDASLRQRKFFLVLPLLVLPFLTLAFWSLGGGQGSPIPGDALAASGGLSLTLPDPQFRKGKEGDKFSLYEQARRRLQRPAAEQESRLLSTQGHQSTPEEASWPDVPPVRIEEAASSPAADQEEKINQRLAQLTTLVSSPSKTPAPAPSGIQSSAKADVRFHQDVDRLEALMQQMGRPSTPNPEMQQMEALLERILDIQHPERVRSQSEENTSHEPPSALMHGHAHQAAITLLGSSPASPIEPRDPAFPGETAPMFYSLSALQSSPEAGGNTVTAVIPATQTLTTGALVRLRLLEEMHLGGTHVPRGSLLYGTCRLRGERLIIDISSVRAGQSILPVTLAAFDLDGQEGLFVPGAGAREAARQGAGRAVQQSLQLPSLSPTLGAQATSAGIATARDMLSRQTRQVKVTVKAGHRLLLRNR